MSSFDERAAERWARGVRKCRGGDDALPFAGDPIVEGREECLDLANYATEAAAQGRLSEEKAVRLHELAQEADRILGEVEDGWA